MGKYYKIKCFSIYFPLLHSWVDKSVIFVYIFFLPQRPCLNSTGSTLFLNSAGIHIPELNNLQLKEIVWGRGKKSLQLINSSEKRVSRHKVLFCNEACKKCLLSTHFWHFISVIWPNKYLPKVKIVTKNIRSISRILYS